MRYSTLIGSVTLSLILTCVPLPAQHAAGHAGSAHGAASAGFSGFARPTHSPGVYYGAVAPIQPTPIGLQPYPSGYTGINPGALQTSRSGIAYPGGRRGYYPGAFAFPYYFSTYDDSLAPWAYNQYSEDPNAQTAQTTANLLGEQIQRLSVEVEQLREQASVPPQTYPAYTPAPTAAPAQDDPPIVLVLNGGNKIQLASYAIMDGAIWDFSKQPARRIPLNNVNVAASQQATEARGAEFPAVR